MYPHPTLSDSARTVDRVKTFDGKERKEFKPMRKRAGSSDILVENRLTAQSMP